MNRYSVETRDGFFRSFEADDLEFSEQWVWLTAKGTLGSDVVAIFNRSAVTGVWVGGVDASSAAEAKPDEDVEIDIVLGPDREEELE